MVGHADEKQPETITKECMHLTALPRSTRMMPWVCRHLSRWGTQAILKLTAYVQSNLSGGPQPKDSVTVCVVSSQAARHWVGASMRMPGDWSVCILPEAKALMFAVSWFTHIR